jgi:hypothetical protein
MNAEEIYKKYIAPEPETVQEPKEITVSDITCDPALWATGPSWGPTGGGGLSATDFNRQYNTYKPLAFIVDDVQLVKDRDAFGYNIIIKMLCTFGDYHFVYEKVVDEFLFRDPTRTGEVIDMLSEDAMKDMLVSMGKHFDIRTKISDALTNSSLNPCMPKPTPYVGTNWDLKVKNPHPMFNTDAV